MSRSRMNADNLNKLSQLCAKPVRFSPEEKHSILIDLEIVFTKTKGLYLVGTKKDTMKQLKEMLDHHDTDPNKLLTFINGKITEWKNSKGMTFFSSSSSSSKSKAETLYNDNVSFAGHDHSYIKTLHRLKEIILLHRLLHALQAGPVTNLAEYENMFRNLRDLDQSFIGEEMSSSATGKSGEGKEEKKTIASSDFYKKLGYEVTSIHSEAVQRGNYSYQQIYNKAMYKIQEALKEASKKALSAPTSESSSSMTPKNPSSS